MNLKERIKEIKKEANQDIMVLEMTKSISEGAYYICIAEQKLAKKALSIIEELQNKLEEMTKCRDNALEMPWTLAREIVDLREENQQLFNKNKELEAKLKETK